MKRREFLATAARQYGRTAGALLLLPWERLSVLPSSRPTVTQLLLPMDDSQANHLKAYGVTFRALKRGGRA